MTQLAIRCTHIACVSAAQSWTSPPGKTDRLERPPTHLSMAAATHIKLRTAAIQAVQTHLCRSFTRDKYWRDATEDAQQTVQLVHCSAGGHTQS